MMTDLSMRDAVSADAAALLAIYRPFVLDTAVSFELEPPSAAEFERRIVVAQSSWVWLVAERGSDLGGYACASSYKSRAAYRWSVETAVYVHESHRGQGVGMTLYSQLMAVLAEKGYCTAYAGITLPNDVSIRLHRSAGFREIGVFRRAGWKFGRWHDVSWWQRELRDRPPDE
jgi:L-amino acid N-acyltransferase YncA